MSTSALIFHALSSSVFQARRILGKHVLKTTKQVLNILLCDLFLRSHTLDLNLLWLTMKLCKLNLRRSQHHITRAPSDCDKQLRAGAFSYILTGSEAMVSQSISELIMFAICRFVCTWHCTQLVHTTCTVIFWWQSYHSNHAWTQHTEDNTNK